MAKDTEKLIRQLSLISFLLAERRPLTAQEIRRSVEGYATMNEEAFARRFYADRMELEALGIGIEVRRPTDSAVEQETYSLRPERLRLPPINFSGEELVALQMALKLLDGRFAYAQPLRLAFQQVTWESEPPLLPPTTEAPVRLGVSASARSAEDAQRLAKIEAGIVRRKTVIFDYHSLERDEVSTRKVDPYHLLYQNGEFYLIGYAHERGEVRVFRLSRIKGRVSFATKSEHDFRPPTDFDPRPYAQRAEWQLGRQRGIAEIEVDGQLGWYVKRQFGRYGTVEDLPDGRVRFHTPYANDRALISWLLSLRGHGRLEGPPQLVEELERRLELLEERQRNVAAALREEGLPKVDQLPVEEEARATQAAIKPERFARLMALATVLIDAGRNRQTLRLTELARRLGISKQELREDISILNVVNFGGGMYVLYAEIEEDARGKEEVVRVDPEPYSDTFEKPVRLLPIEAKALIAAIDLLGSHLAGGALARAREKIVAALGNDAPGLLVEQGGDDPELGRLLSEAIERREVVRLEYYKPDQDRLEVREVEPLALALGREGWYLAAFDPSRQGIRHFRLDRIKQATTTGKVFARRGLDPGEELPEWLRTGYLQGAKQAVVWVAPERARWVRERYHQLAERRDGSALVVIPYGSQEWLVGAVLREAGDAVVVEPAEAGEEVLAAVARLRRVAVSS
jgi:predicted DNA-binding transcriptional regulator YafY